MSYIQYFKFPVSLNIGFEKGLSAPREFPELFLEPSSVANATNTLN